MRPRTDIEKVMIAASMMVALAFGLNLWSSHAAPISELSSAYVTPDTPEEAAKQYAEYIKEQQVCEAGEFHKPLLMLADFPGVEEPELLPVASTDLPPSTSVIGVEVDGEFCAFVLNSMHKPQHHIVNLRLNEKPLSVTYCNLVDCIRVLTSEADETIPLHVGGLDIDHQMVFLLGDERYGQASIGLPLKDHAYSRTTLSQWKDLHPSTKVYVGPPSTSSSS